MALFTRVLPWNSLMRNALQILCILMAMVKLSNCQTAWYRDYIAALREFQAGEYKSSIALFLKVIENDPTPELDKFISSNKRDDYLPYYFLGQAYYYTSDIESARHFLIKSEENGAILESKYKREFDTFFKKVEQLVKNSQGNQIKNMWIKDDQLRIYAPGIEKDEQIYKIFEENLVTKINGTVSTTTRVSNIQDTLVLNLPHSSFTEGLNEVSFEFRNGSDKSKFEQYISSFRESIHLWYDKIGLEFYEPYSEKKALVIAISQYSSESGFARLSSAVKQSQELSGILSAQGFAVTELYNSQATKEAIELAIYNLKVDKNGNVLIYFGGHGHSIETKVGNDTLGYLVPFDGKKDQLNTLIPMTLIRTDFAYQVQGKHVLFLIDACASGLAIERGINEKENIDNLLEIKRLTKDNGRFAYVAGRGGEPAMDFNGGIFTNALIQALKHAEADIDDNGIITLNELEDYVDSVVFQKTRDQQHPMLDRKLVPNLAKSQFIFFSGRKKR